MKAIKAPKFSISAPRSVGFAAVHDFLEGVPAERRLCRANTFYSPPRFPARTRRSRPPRPPETRCSRGMRCFSSTAPKNFFGKALLRPMPYRRRAAPICEPRPEPKFASSSVNPTMVNKRRPGAARPHTSRPCLCLEMAATRARSVARCRLRKRKGRQSPRTSRPWPAGYFVAGFSASSESVDIPSNPI